MLPDAGAWRRFLARSFDMWWQVPALFAVATVGLTLALPSYSEWAALHGRSQIVYLLCIPLSLLLDAILLARFGRSPGKALLGLRLVTDHGERLGYRAAVRRNLRMWVTGLAMTIPVLGIATAARQGWRVSRGHGASYDAGRYRVEARPIGWRRWIGFVFATLLLACVTGLTLDSIAQTGAPAPDAPPFTWTNPETGDAVTIPSGWEHQFLTGEDGEPLHIFRLFNSRAALLFSVQPAGLATLIDMTRDTNALLEGVEMGAGRREPFLGNPSWAAEGFADDVAVTRLEVRVVHHDGRYWRVIAAQQYPYRDSTARVDTLRTLLWSSVMAQPAP